MKRTFFSKIFIGYVVIILMLSLASLLAFSHTSRTLYRETVAENLKDTATILRSDAVDAIVSGDIKTFESRARRIARELNIRTTLVDSRGVVLSDSLENPSTMENHRNRPEIIEALNGKTGLSSRFSSTTNQEAMYVAIPVGEKAIGVVRTSMMLKDVRVPSSLVRHMIQIAAFLSVLALAGAYLIARSASVPIRELTSSARKMASGEFNTRVFLDRSDEFKTLADAFNVMSKEIETSFNAVAQGRQELRSIIDSLREGLIAIDRRGTVLYCNESMKTIFGQTQPTEGKPYWEVFTDGVLSGLVEKGRQSGGALVDEAIVGERTFLSSVTRLEPQGQMVLVFHDITSIKQLEKIKRDLVANVSHELRTPLTSIKGFAETLEEEVDEPARHYVEIIKRNTNRLIRIVEDLLVLSRLEEKEVRVELDDVDIEKLLHDTARIFEHKAKEKGLLLKVHVEPPVKPIRADRFKLEQMFINLLDNAVKYTDAGEIRIEIKPGDRGVVIEVHDTGIGIPADKIPHIFERFYVVDVSRSRLMGGTGLGLSIVKHIILLHRGTVRVESAPGRGTHFFITLPSKLE